MKSWAAGAEIVGASSAVATVAATVSAGAAGVATVGPQLAMTMQLPAWDAGIEPWQQPQECDGARCGAGMPAWPGIPEWQSSPALGAITCAIELSAIARWGSASTPWATTSTRRAKARVIRLRSMTLHEIGQARPERAVRS